MYSHAWKTRFVYLCSGFFFLFLFYSPFDVHQSDVSLYAVVVYAPRYELWSGSVIRPKTGYLNLTRDASRGDDVRDGMGRFLISVFA